MAEFWLPKVRAARKLTKDVNVLVLALAADGKKEKLIGLPDDTEAAFAEAFGASALAVAKSLGAKSEIGRTVALAGPGKLRLVVVGAGELELLDDDESRRAAGAAMRHVIGLPSTKPLKVAIGFATDPDLVGPTAEGALLGCYEFLHTSPHPPVYEIRIISNDDVAFTQMSIELAVIRSHGVCLARQWTNLPSNLLFPDSFATDIAKEAKQRDVEFEIWDEQRLAEEGFGGILAVGGGSERKPRLVKLHYAPPTDPEGDDDAPLVHLALVGTGITFDSGGLDLKPPESMYTMKHDMAGAAAVVAAILTLAEYRPDIEITAWAALAENMPSGSAYRPSDVITMYDGTLVENANTDAEGRLVLADALARAAEDSPSVIVDVATLTGACVVALGERVAGFFANSEGASGLISTAAMTSGELFWELPIPGETRKKLDSKVAHLKSGADRKGGALLAAAFLREFVPDDVLWAHLDIAGPAFNVHEPYDHISAEATGFGVLTLVNLAVILSTLDEYDDEYAEYAAEDED
jgi:leucyl aminopeptidase